MVASSYPDSEFVWNNNGSDFSGLFNSTWSTYGDAAFYIDFLHKCESEKCSAVTVEAGMGIRGDSNGDGNVDFNDINPFVTALISCDDWTDETGLPLDDCRCRNDIDQDGEVNFNDIDCFVQCLIDGYCS